MCADSSDEWINIRSPDTCSKSLLRSCSYSVSAYSVQKPLISTQEGRYIINGWECLGTGQGQIQTAESDARECMALTLCKWPS